MKASARRRRMPDAERKTMTAKRLPLPKRFNVAITEKAYERLRAMSANWHFGNNYLLTILLENFGEVVDENAWNSVMRQFVEENGQPSAGSMRQAKLGS